MKIDVSLYDVDLSQSDIDAMWNILMQDKWGFEIEVIDYLIQQVIDDNVSAKDELKEFYLKLKDYYKNENNNG